MMQKKIGLFRPSHEPSVDVPLGARSVGHYRVPGDFREKPMVKHFVQVFWGIRGSGILVIGGEERVLRPDHIAIYFSGMEHHLYARGEPWEYRWWTMDGPLASSVTTSFGLVRAGIFAVGPVPIRIFQELERRIRDLTPNGERRASATAYQLLSHAAGHQSESGTDPLIRQAMVVIHQEWHSPEFDVNRRARVLEMNRSVLTRKFNAAIGVSPIAFITNLRTQNALSLLKQTSLSMAEVAQACGWDDPNYFSRCIQRTTGVSPKVFRRS